MSYMSYTSYTSNNSGFTLVEILVAMAIFVTAATAIAAIFSYTTASQRKTEIVQKAQGDARFAMEVLSQEIRKGSVKYAAYDGGVIPADPQDLLVLLDQDRGEVWFREQDGAVQISETGAVGSWESLTPPDITVDLLRFYITPSTDPFVDAPASSSQPRVTIVLSTSSTPSNTDTPIRTFLQTTVSSRQYLR